MGVGDFSGGRGYAGIGVNFLEETFRGRQANPVNRMHEAAVQRVLRALLPDVTTDIKGHQRSREELLDASGYADHPADFDELMHVLDQDLKLITPTKEHKVNRVVAPDTTSWPTTIWCPRCGNG